jgi:hypothetical protein
MREAVAFMCAHDSSNFHHRHRSRRCGGVWLRTIRRVDIAFGIPPGLDIVLGYFALALFLVTGAPALALAAFGWAPSVMASV